MRSLNYLYLLIVYLSITLKVESRDSRDKCEQNLGNRKLTRICPEDEPKCCGAVDNRHCCSTGIQIYFVSIAITALSAITFASVGFIVCLVRKVLHMSNRLL